MESDLGASHEAFKDVLARGVVHGFGLADDGACDLGVTCKAVDEAEFKSLFAVPDQAAEDGFVGAEFRAATVFDAFNELLVGLLQLADLRVLCWSQR